MRTYRPARHVLGAAAGVALLLAAVWQLSTAIAATATPTPSPTPAALAPALTATPTPAPAPAPNPLPASTNPVLGPVPGVDITKPGEAAGIHGDPVAGRAKFATSCATCHADRGVGNVPNPGSNDGIVPALNPIDPGFISDSNGNAAIFARELDLFLQHGSAPAGPSPKLSMLGFGDHKLMPQPDIADIEAYVMQLNGTYWPDRWAPPVEVQMQAVRSDGDVSYVTYRVMLINHSGGTLGKLDLREVLPSGTNYITSFVPGPGQNGANVTNQVLDWLNADGIPVGGAFGPFTTVVQLQDAKAPVAPTNAWLSFTWVGWDGTVYSSSAASALTAPTLANH